MIGVSAGLLSHISGRSTSLAPLWLITRQDGQVFGFTSHDADITHDGVTYVARYGIDPSAVRAGASLAVSNSEVSTVFSAAGMTADDLRAGRWDFADVRIRWINWRDTSQGVAKLQRGWLGEVRHDGFRFTAELLGLSTLLNRSRGRVVTPACDAVFGDARCTVDLAPHTTAATVTGVTSRRVFTCDLTGAGVDAYTDGRVVWSTGNNAGLQMEIKGNDAAGVFSLALPMPLDIQVGDTLDVILGCARSAEACQGYGNIENFRGFQFVVGPDRAFKAGGQ